VSIPDQSSNVAALAGPPYVISGFPASGLKNRFMSKNIQILVPRPCGQNWDVMAPSGNGRFCGSCQKTVVDFTNMSDGEVLTWLADTNKKTCGRFDADQLNRKLVPLPERKRKAWVIWQFVLAGLLIYSRSPAQTKVSRTPMIQRDRQQLAGDLFLRGAPTKVDSPEYKTLAPVVVWGYAMRTCRGVMGGTVASVQIDTIPVLRKFAKDTLAFLGMTKKELTFYPNPAVRGTAIRYTLPSKFPGEGKLGLFDSGGALLQQQSIAHAPTETFNLPATLPAGIYFVKLTPVGTGKEYTQKLVVL
jgi:hypothetical protein